MTDLSTAPPPAAAPAPEPKKNPFARMLGVIISPGETLRDIAARPDFLVAIIVILLLAIGTAIMTAPHLDMRASLQPMLEKQGLKVEQQDKAIEIAEKIKAFSAPLGAIFYLVYMVVIAGVFFLACKMLGTAGRFKQFFSVTVYAWIPQVIQAVITTLLVIRKGSITTEEMMTTLKSNLSFTTSQVASPPLFALYGLLDLFNFWTIFLLVVGYSYASGLSRPKAAGLVIGLWAFTVLVRVGLASMGGAH